MADRPDPVEQFAELGGKAELDTELTGFSQGVGGVDAITTAGPIRARYLVGCDGGRSTVRKTPGVGLCQGDVRDGAPPHTIRAYLNRYHLAL